MFFFLVLAEKRLYVELVKKQLNNFLSLLFFFKCVDLYCEIGLRQISKLLFQKLECVYKMYISDPFFKIIV